MSNNKPKIIFLNFQAKEIKKLKNLGRYEYELGYADTESSNHYYPSSPYDYQIAISNVDYQKAKNVAGKFEGKAEQGLDDGKLLKKHCSFNLCFLGYSRADLFTNFGIGEIAFTQADKRDKDFYSVNTYESSFDHLFKKYDFLLPIRKYIICVHPLNKLIANKNRDVVAAYTQDFYYSAIKEGQELRVTSLLSPFFAKHIKIVDEILGLIPTFRPDLFPQLASDVWLEKKDFLPVEVKSLDSEINQKKKEFIIWLRDANKKREKIKEIFKFLTQILIADDEHFKGKNKLSCNVEKVLKDILGFETRDIDKELLKARKTVMKEDYWVYDDDYFAICEVTGTQKKNPKVKEYHEILSKIKSVLTRKGIPTKFREGGAKGLLIINHDRLGYPFSRPKLYTGELEEYVKAAKESGISIISTVELYKIAMAVKEKGLDKKQARDILKQGGRIVFKPNEKKAKTTK
jgi:hypothetical protein